MKSSFKDKIAMTALLLLYGAAMFAFGAYLQKNGLLRLSFKPRDIFKEILQKNEELRSLYRNHRKLLNRDFPPNSGTTATFLFPGTVYPGSSRPKQGPSYCEADIAMKSSDIALVLIDTWIVDNENKRKTVFHNICRLLKIFRQYDVTVIHAPHAPVTKRYPRHAMLLHRIDSFDREFRGILRRYEGETFSHSYPYVMNSRESRPEITLTPPHRQPGARQKARLRRIPDRVAPRPGEFVIETYREMRYILWTRRIGMIVFVGGSINQCLLTRPTGICRFLKSPLVLTVLEDCIWNSPSPSVDRESNTQAMLDFLMYNGVYVSALEKMTWNDESGGVVRTVREPLNPRR